MRLTEHFTLEELARTSHTEIDNTPPPKVMPNLIRTADTLEKVRKVLGRPLKVTSGYRSHELNRKIGGSALSAHMDGRAADFVAPLYGNPLEICKAIIAAGIQFDQLIYEKTWVHIGIAPQNALPRGQVLSLVRPGSYADGLVP